jgi:hypothetical protein
MTQCLVFVRYKKAPLFVDPDGVDYKCRINVYDRCTVWSTPVREKVL